MRVAVVAHRALYINGHGGLERAATELATGFAARGVEVELISSRLRSGVAADLGRFPFRVTLLPPSLRDGVRGWWDYRRWTAEVARYLPGVRADFVVSFYGDLHAVTGGPPSLVFPFGLEWLVTPGFHGLGLRSLYGPMLRRGVRQATYFGTAGPWHTKRMRGLLATFAEPMVIHNWKRPDPPLLPREEARSALGIPADAVLLGIVSRLVADKQIHLAVEAVRRLRPEFPHLRLVIAGEGRDRARLEAAAGGDRGVAFLGRVDDATARLLIRASDATVNVARTEYQLFQVIEALAVGTPVLCTDAERQEGLIEHGRTGFALRAVDVESVVEGLRWVIGLRTPERVQVEASCRAAVAEGYTLEDAVNRVLQLAARGQPHSNST